MPAKIRHQPQHLFLIACLGMLLFGITMITLGTVLPEIIARYQVSELEASTLTLILPFGVLISSVLFGPLADRYGYKGVLMIAAALVMAGLLGFAYAPNWTGLMIGTFLAGLGGGALNGGTNGLVVDTTAGEDSSARVSLLGVFFGVGALGMPLLLGALSQWFSNEQIIAGIALGILPILLYMAVIPFPPPKLNRESSFKDGLGVIRYPVLWLLGMVLFFQAGLEGIVNNWSTSYLQQSLGIARDPSLYLLTIYMAALTLTRILLGAILNRFSPLKALMIGVGLILLGGVLWLMAQSYLLLVIAMVLMGMGFAGTFPIVLAQVGKKFSAFSGTAFSFVLVLSIFGNMGANYSVGLIGNELGLQYTPWILLGWAILMVGTVAWTLRLLKKTA